MKRSTPQTCLTQEVMLQYLREELNAKETYQVESHLMDCRKCNETIEEYACTHNSTDHPARPIPQTLVIE